MSQNTITEIDLSIEQAKRLVEMGQAVDRLMKNRDFKKVVLEDYFEKEAASLVHSLSMPQMQTPERQQALHNEMQAIALFRRHLDFLRQQAESVAADLREYEQEKADVLAEGLDD